MGNIENESPPHVPYHSIQVKSNTENTVDQSVFTHSDQQQNFCGNRITCPCLLAGIRSLQ